MRLNKGTVIVVTGFAKTSKLDMVVGKEYVVTQGYGDGTVSVIDDAGVLHAVDKCDYTVVNEGVKPLKVTSTIWQTFTVNGKNVTVSETGVLFSGILTVEEFKAIAAAL